MNHFHLLGATDYGNPVPARIALSGRSGMRESCHDLLSSSLRFNWNSTPIYRGGQEVPQKGWKPFQRFPKE